VNLVGAALERRAPGWARRWALRALFRATARAFDRPLPSLAGLSADQRLLRYAERTRDWAGELLRDGGDPAAVQARLYRNALRLGQACRWLCGLRGQRDALAMGRLLYRWLEIDFRADGEAILIRRCYFSRLYSSDICQVMSALDRGLLAGLSGGRQLAFSERITEGRPGCRARLTREDGRG